MNTDKAPLAGKVALVTGGSRGIGRAIVRRLAEDGADVALTYARSAGEADAAVKEVEAAGGRGLAVPADAADPRAVTEAVARTVAALGRLDILVNNAGAGGLGPLESLSLELVDEVLAVNVRSAFLMAQAAAPHLGAGGRIVNIGSCMADRVPGPGGTLYALSKSALTGLTKALARELGGRAITANLVSPGPIDTEMNPAGGPMADGQRALTALGHFGEGADVAAMVAHLAGDGGRFVTGATLSVDGGHAA
ncbi:3-oxoacyl-ACP reductase family protein [Actinomadura sp. DC4]|uniref:3-oxoacyl-ACP reductase family protein n=1 Tax=Actinomadura sp. DC4 TaxID=3055069 RepID=UPI0025B12737|nr:3-oxoacyl-ACP reductase family protein [Actinomadura sp. DC4]MDN3359910.1 3-oxoacyl-ACP reductase family protein [Actinomadura sp. DC4]